jgi:hypothetical protein
VAVSVTSFPEYQEVFGDFIPNGDMALGAAGFFENGGSQLWVVRTVHYTDVNDPATATATRATGNVVSGATTVYRVEGKHPGRYAEALEVRFRPNAGSTAFDLTVEEGGVARETFSGLSANRTAERYALRVLDAPRVGSKLIRLVDLNVPSAPTPTAQTVRPAGGSDGLTGLTDTDFTGTEAAKNGIRALDAIYDLSLLLVPGRATPVVHNGMVTYCELTRGGTVFPVLDPPAGYGAVEMVRYVETTAKLLELSEHGALYWPRVKIVNPSRRVYGPDAVVVAPPSGVVSGVIARGDNAREGGIYDPPAGIENGRMYGVYGFEVDESLDERKRDIVYPKRINPLTTDVGLPYFIDGSRTLKSTGNFPYVSERRGVSFIARSIRQGLQFARHKYNTEALRARVRRTIYAFLVVQMRNGAFRTNVAATAFFVDVGDAINTPSVIASGQLVADVGLATSKPAEFIVVRVSSDTRAIDAELAGERR